MGPSIFTNRVSQAAGFSPPGRPWNKALGLITAFLMGRGFARRFGGLGPNTRTSRVGRKLHRDGDNTGEELADRPVGFRPKGRKPIRCAPVGRGDAAYTGASLGVKTIVACDWLVEEPGPHSDILREIPISDIEQAAGPCVAEGIRRMRVDRHRSPYRPDEPCVHRR